MLSSFIPANNPETPFNTREIKKKKNKDGSYNKEAVYVVGTLQATYMKTARMWQILALSFLGALFLSIIICAYSVTRPATVPVIVTVNDEGYANYVGKIDKSYWGAGAIPENAKTFQIKRLVGNMNTWVIDKRAQQGYIKECESICQGQAIDLLNTFFLENNPFSWIGIRTRTVDIEEPMKQTERTYVVYYNVTTFDKGMEMERRRYSMLVTLDFFKGVPETNPLGIYISSFDIKPVTVN